MPPAARMMEMAFGYVLSRAVGAAVRLGVSDLLEHGPRSVGDLAASTQTNADALGRMLRTLAASGVFMETSPGVFANTELSDVLRANAPHSARALTLFITDEMHWNVWGEFLHSVRTGQPSFDHVYQKRPWEWLAENPEASAAFDNAMSSHSSVDAEAVAASYEFREGAAVMDVAGGNGLLLRTILDRSPGLRGILFDQPHVIEHARTAGQLPAERCDLAAGSFFESIPSGADYYLMKHIIHDWDDERAAAILGTVRRAISTVGKLLVLEMALPPANQPGFARLLDLEMLVIPGGRERTTEEYRALFRETGFELTRVIPAGPRLTIFEAQPV